jgi:hypothetical protein
MDSYDCKTANHADRAAEAGRLLRVLFLWLGTVSAYSGRAFGRDRPSFLLCGVIPHGKRGPKFTDRIIVFQTGDFVA